MVSVDGLLDAHEVAVRARIEELRVALADAERDLEHVVITRDTLRVVVAEGAAVVRAVKVAGGEVSDQVPVTVPGLEPVVVPLRGEGMDEQALPVGYRSMWLAARSAGEGVRAGDLARALGLPATNSAREGLRTKLKRLAARGWAVEAVPGVFRMV
ncbi:hypothetical protein KGQ20_15525 [Catenulispora sp. NF23]|uniref:Uncharacterized protein n=1 Tax=Catenulispora pinistramenti TaxID=2705254 RepID=A0ABS5L8N6_9ACTN|nr:hypothetical protein [Catenulispora pinistramenti]MBS2534181.1 hypothetical protein [Catenulispora pinistramenti]MBS2554723.1 hypothetical protein [Catenulispora pinistramenti]